MTEPTTLYRFFDADEVLLYIGIAGNPGRRFGQHSTGPDAKPWWHRVDHSTMEHFESRAEALEAEKAAIIDEHPLFNVVHNRRPATPGQVLLVCHACDQVVTAGQGWFEVDRAQAHRHAMACRPNPGGLVDLAAVFEAGGRARWRGVHRACAASDEGRWLYDLEPIQVSTMAGVIATTAHLMGKRWIDSTDWSNVLFDLSSGALTGPLRDPGAAS